MHTKGEKERKKIERKNRKEEKEEEKKGFCRSRQQSLQGWQVVVRQNNATSHATRQLRAEGRLRYAIFIIPEA